jgi:hypothetical protein
VTAARAIAELSSAGPKDRCPHGRDSSPDRCSQCLGADPIRWPEGRQLALPTVRRIKQRRRRI